MSFNLLKGKRGIIFGALNDASIAWKVAERAVEEGAQIVLTNTAVACRMGTIDELAKKTGAVIIPADATSVEDLTNCICTKRKSVVKICRSPLPWETTDYYPDGRYAAEIRSVGI